MNSAPWQCPVASGLKVRVSKRVDIQVAGLSGLKGGKAGHAVVTPERIGHNGVGRNAPTRKPGNVRLVVKALLSAHINLDARSMASQAVGCGFDSGLWEGRRRMMANQTSAIKAMAERASQIKESLDAFSQNERVFSTNRPRLIDKYEGKWIAVFQGKVAASADTIEEVAAGVEEQGIPLSDTMIRHIGREAKTYIF